MLDTLNLINPLKWYDIDRLDNRDPRLIERLARWYGPLLMRYFRAQVHGVERIPRGAALYVGNHSSALLTLDSFIFGLEVLRTRGVQDVPYGLGHEWAIRIPLLHQVIVPLGAVRASHDNAHRLFEAGHKVLVYPGGDVDAMRPYRHRNRVVWDGRTGFMRLSLRERVPIVPVVSAGAHGMLYIIDDLRGAARLLGLHRPPFRTHVWPLTLSIPWGLTVGPPVLYVPFPARIWMEVLPPMTFSPDGPEAAEDDEHVRACAEQVRATMERALRELDAARVAAGQG